MKAQVAIVNGRMRVCMEKREFLLMYARSEYQLGSPLPKSNVIIFEIQDNKIIIMDEKRS